MFVRGGGVWPGEYLEGVGNFGGHWSSVVYYSDYAYLLYFYSGYDNPSDYGRRYLGFSVRRVALGN